MKLDPIIPPEAEQFLPPAVRGDKLIRINISRNTLLAFVFSILLHAIALMLVIPKIEFNPPPGTAPTTIQVSLAPPTPAPVPEVVTEAPPVEPVPEPAKLKPSVKPQPVKPPKVMTQAKSLTNPPTFTVPEVVDPTIPTPEVAAPPEKVSPPATDMLAYVKARQAARGVVPEANQDAAASPDANLSEDALRDQRIAKNLTGGAGGTFTLTSLDHRRATFAFNGWVNSLSNTKRQFFEVEAGAGQDVRVLMVKRIISFIRESYPGDFPWNSHRLGKVVTLSARPEDNNELEEFLMVEFFGTNYRIS